MKLVEQELWQREEKGLIGILPVRDAAEAAAVGPMLSQGDFLLIFSFDTDECASVFDGTHERKFLVGLFLILGIGSDSGEKSSRVQVGTSDSQRVDGKNQQDIHWHSRYTRTKNLFCCVLSNVWLKGVNVLCYTLCGMYCKFSLCQSV